MLTGGMLAAGASLLLLLLPSASSAAPQYPVKTLTISANNPSPAWVLPPGATVGAGYRVDKIDSAAVQVTNATVTVPFSCTAKGPEAGALVIDLPDATLTGAGWQPPGTPASVWQTAGQVVDPGVVAAACGSGSTVYAGQKAGETVFQADFTSPGGGDQLMVQFHIRQVSPTETPAGWSGVEKVVTGSSTPPPSEEAVLSAIKASSPASGGTVGAGQTVTYTVTLSNSGSVAAADVRVTDLVDTDTTYVAGSASNGGSLVSGAVTWTGLTIPAKTGSTNGTLVLTFRALVPLGTKSSTSVDNTALFSDFATPGCTPTSGMCPTNTTHLTVVGSPPPPPVVVTSPVLSTVKSSSPASGSSVGLGQTVTYTLALTNAGTGPATNVTVTDAVPAGTTYVAGSASNGGSLVSGTVTWTSLTVAAGGSLPLSFRVTVNAGDTNGQAVTNLGRVTNAGTPGCTTSSCPTNTVSLTVAVPATSPTVPTTVPATVPTTTAPVPILKATTVHTGEPWAGSRPLELGMLATGMSLVGLGLRQRRRLRLVRR